MSFTLRKSKSFLLRWMRSSRSSSYDDAFGSFLRLSFLMNLSIILSSSSSSSLSSIALSKLSSSISLLVSFSLKSKESPFSFLPSSPSPLRSLAEVLLRVPYGCLRTFLFFFPSSSGSVKSSIAVGGFGLRDFLTLFGFGVCNCSYSLEMSGALKTVEGEEVNNGMEKPGCNVSC